MKKFSKRSFAWGVLFCGFCMMAWGFQQKYDDLWIVNKLGIGISAPAAQSHIHDSASGSVYQLYTNVTTGSTAADGYKVGIDSSEGATHWNAENTYMRFATNNIERIRLNASGEFGIGCTATELVQAQEDQNATSMIQVRNDSTGASARSRFSMHVGGVEAGYIAANYSAAGSDIVIGNRINNDNADILFKTKDGVKSPLTIKGNGAVEINGLAKGSVVAIPFYFSASSNPSGDYAYHNGLQCSSTRGWIPPGNGSIIAWSAVIDGDSSPISGDLEVRKNGSVLASLTVSSANGGTANKVGTSVAKGTCTFVSQDVISFYLGAGGHSGQIIVYATIDSYATTYGNDN
jgi:hypothetical protein